MSTQYSYLSPQWREAAAAAQSEAVCTGQQHVWEYDGATFAVPCSCHKKDKFARHLLKISALLEGKTFENFDASRDQVALAESMALIETYDPKVGAVITGIPGNGKSHLAKAMVRASLDQRKGIANFIRAIDLASTFRASQGYGERAEESLEEMAWLRRSSLLVVDDVGSQRATKSDVWEEQLQNFIDGYAGILVITTNLSGRSFVESVGQKVYDRLLERCVSIKTSGPSYRQEHRPTLEARGVA